MAKDRAKAQLPASYNGSFFKSLDIESALTQNVQDRLTQLTRELGGDEVMTSVRMSHVRNYIALGVLIEGILHEALHGREYDAGVLTQLINTETGIGRILGMERRPRALDGVQDHLRKRRPSESRQSAAESRSLAAA